MNRTLPAASLLVAALALSSVADAQQPQQPVQKARIRLPVTKAPTSAQPEPPAATPPPVVTPPAADAAAQTPAAADTTPKVKGKEDADQKKRRTDYVARMTKEMRTLARADGTVSAQEKEVVRNHWRRSMRALRIRLLAEDDKDQALVGRVDAYLAKIDKAVLDKLKAGVK